MTQSLITEDLVPADKSKGGASMQIIDARQQNTYGLCVAAQDDQE